MHLSILSLASRCTPVLLAPVLLAAGGTAAAQQSVIETRVFNQEVFTADSSNYEFDLGLASPTSITDGSPVRVTAQLVIVQDYDIQVRNLSGATHQFLYQGETGVLPAAAGDCSMYQYVSASDDTGPIADGDLAVMVGSRTHSVNFDWASFNSGCGAPWVWHGLELWDGIVTSTPLSYDGHAIPPDWFEVLQFDFTVTGTFTVEWVPNALPSQVICSGSSQGATTLSAGGSNTNFWLFQDGAPDSWNLMLAAREASSIVPQSGLCVGAGGGAVVRLADSLSLGAEPFRYPLSPAQAGQPLYFQSWFRTPNGSETSECIEVTLP